VGECARVGHGGRGDCREGDGKKKTAYLKIRARLYLGLNAAGDVAGFNALFKAITFTLPVPNRRGCVVV
jgi:hypothetical protein